MTTQLESELKEKQKLTDAFSDISTLQAQKKETEQKLTDVSVERDKLRAENKVVLKHDQVCCYAVMVVYIPSFNFFFFLNLNVFWTF